MCTSPIHRMAAAAALALLAGSAGAQTATATFTVSATVSSTCSVSAAALAFGAYDPLSATDTSGSSSITVRCTLSTNYSVGLDAGLNGAAIVTDRKMNKGTDLLGYSLYRDAARTQVWGEAGADLASGTGTGVDQVLTVYGLIPAGQNVPPGSYSDDIVVTVTF